MIYVILAIIFLTKITYADSPINKSKAYLHSRHAIGKNKSETTQVTQFFWYGCPKCYRLEIGLKDWMKKKSQDIQIIRIPAMLGGSWDIYGKVYLTLEAMDKDESMHKALFQAIHEKKINFRTIEEIAIFLQNKGLDRIQFLSFFHSFFIEMRTWNTKKLVKKYSISSVPLILFNGKEIPEIESSNRIEQILFKLDQLISRGREISSVKLS